MIEDLLHLQMTPLLVRMIDTRLSLISLLYTDSKDGERAEDYLYKSSFSMCIPSAGKR